MAQAARLNLRMQKELKLLITDPPPGASFPHLSPSSDLSSFSLTAIDALIEGPEGTVYEKGVFKIKIQIPERYPFQPPVVTFGTPIYHPNIDTGGRICLDILNLPPKGAWQPSLNISTVLTSIGLLLSEPNPDDGLMCEASREYKYNKQVFDQKARSMTEKYARSDASPNHGALHSLTDSIMREDKPQELVKTDLYDHAASFKKFSGIGKKLSLDASCSGSNTKESNNGMNEAASNTLCPSQIQEPKQDPKDMPIVGKDHVSTVIKSDCDRDNKPQELVKTGLYEQAASYKKVSGKGRKLSLDTSCLGSNTRESDKGMNEIASNTLNQPHIQEPKEYSKDMPFDGKDHVSTVIKSDHDRYKKPPAISSKKLRLSSKNLQNETLDSTRVCDLDAQKENLLQVQKKSTDGNGLTNSKHWTGRKLSLDASCSGLNTWENGKSVKEIAVNTLCQSQIQEPKQDLKEISLMDKDQILTVINSDHDQDNKPPAISSKKLCLSSKNLLHDTLDSTMDRDAQKENLLKVQKKSTDGNGLTNPKRKRLGLTGMKPYSELLGKPQNRKFDGTVKAGEKSAVSTPVLKLPRKPLQVLEAKHGERFDEALEKEGLCNPEEVIVLDSEDSEEEKTTAKNSRRLIARKRVFGKC